MWTSFRLWNSRMATWIRKELHVLHLTLKKVERQSVTFRFRTGRVCRQVVARWVVMRCTCSVTLRPAVVFGRAQCERVTTCWRNAVAEMGHCFFIVYLTHQWTISEAAFIVWIPGAEQSGAEPERQPVLSGRLACLRQLRQTWRDFECPQC